MSNVAAALDKTSLSTADLRLLGEYARETASSYCAGCSHICETALAEAVPVADVMRYLMYYESYDESDRARSLYAGLPAETRGLIPQLEYSVAENICPQKLPIARLMRKADRLLV